MKKRLPLLLILLVLLLLAIGIACYAFFEREGVLLAEIFVERDVNGRDTTYFIYDNQTVVDDKGVKKRVKRADFDELMQLIVQASLYFDCKDEYLHVNHIPQMFITFNRKTGNGVYVGMTKFYESPRYTENENAFSDAFSKDDWIYTLTCNQVYDTIRDVFD